MKRNTASCPSRSSLAAALAALLLPSSCIDPGGAGRGPAQPGSATVYAVGTDYMTTGTLAKIAIPSLVVSPNVIAQVASSDPVLRYWAGRLYIVNRYHHDNVTILDPDTDTLIAQISTGQGTNPWDVAVRGDKIYVAALGSGQIIILDAANPQAAPRGIDISSYDADKIPDANSLYLVGDTLYVTIGLLDPTLASQGGKVLVIDTTTDEVVDHFDLSHVNPLSLLYRAPVDSEFGGDLFITTTDFALGGCLERISLAGARARASCFVPNRALGGYASAVHYGNGRLWLAVNTSYTASKLISVDAAGQVDDTSITSFAQQPTDLVICPSGHMVANDVRSGGLHVYDRNGTQLTSTPLDIGQPPVLVGGLVCF